MKSTHENISRAKTSIGKVLFLPPKHTSQKHFQNDHVSKQTRLEALSDHHNYGINKVMVLREEKDAVSLRF